MAIAMTLFVALIAACATVIVVIQMKSSEAQGHRRMAAVATLTRAYVTEQTAGIERLVAAYGDRLSTTGVLEHGVEALNADLARLRQARPEINVAMLTDSTGVLVAAAPSRPDAVGKSFAYRDWFRARCTRTGRICRRSTSRRWLGARSSWR